MVAILNPKWPPKYKNPLIWAKFGFQVDYDIANWYPNFTGMLSTMTSKIMCTHVRQNFWNVSSNSEHFFRAFLWFPWERWPFWKFRKYSAHLLIVLNIPVKFGYQFAIS
jgi:hypothetical protein